MTKFCFEIHQLTVPRGVFRSIADLQTAINRYLKEHNNDPNPFVWIKPTDVILAKLDRFPVPSG
jgi:hypothetical protein